jgi:hypothetical protein
MDVARSISAKEAIRTLSRLFAERRGPRFVRSENGPELIAR